jgi:hypothetical protein
MVLNKSTIPSLGHIFEAHVSKGFYFFFQAKDLPGAQSTQRVGLGGGDSGICVIFV